MDMIYGYEIEINIKKGLSHRQESDGREQPFFWCVPVEVWLL